MLSQEKLELTAKMIPESVLCYSFSFGNNDELSISHDHLSGRIILKARRSLRISQMLPARFLCSGRKSSKLPLNLLKSKHNVGNHTRQSTWPIISYFSPHYGHSSCVTAIDCENVLV